MLGLPDTISQFDSQFEEKSSKIYQYRGYIGDISTKYRYIGENVGLQHFLEFFRLFFKIFTDLSSKIDDISTLFDKHGKHGRWGPCGFASDEKKVEECRDHGKGPWGWIVDEPKCNNPKGNGGGYFDGITFCHYDSNNSSPQVPPTSPTYFAHFPSIFNYSYFLYHLFPYFYMQFQLYVTYSFTWTNSPM